MYDKEVNPVLQDQYDQLTELVLLQVEHIQHLQDENEKLRAKIARLEKDSSNSSKPPSSDPITRPKKPSKGRGKHKRGGQKGHTKHARKLFPEEEVDDFKQCELSKPDIRKRNLQPLEEYEIFQQI